MVVLPPPIPLPGPLRSDEGGDLSAFWPKEWGRSAVSNVSSRGSRDPVFSFLGPPAFFGSFFSEGAELFETYSSRTNLCPLIRPGLAEYVTAAVVEFPLPPAPFFPSSVFPVGKLREFLPFPPARYAHDDIKSRFWRVFSLSPFLQFSRFFDTRAIAGLRCGLLSHWHLGRPMSDPIPLQSRTAASALGPFVV